MSVEAVSVSIIFGSIWSVVVFVVVLVFLVVVDSFVCVEGMVKAVVVVAV